MGREQAAFAEISPSEFFYRNRDLAGFSNPSRALYMALRELAENSLDACELFRIPPDISIRIIPADIDIARPDPKPYALRVQDNGSGIDPKFVPQAFGRIFFGSKFRLRQARGMFGMGGTMAILYGQITTNKPVTITTSIDGEKATSFQMLIDIQHNTPVITSKRSESANGLKGTSVEVILEGDYLRASPKILEYVRQTALVTPYANLTYVDPLGRLIHFNRITTDLPNPPEETLPHPYGIDVEALRRLLRESKQSSLQKFMYNNFHRVGERTARKFLDFVKLDPLQEPVKLSNDETVTMARALHQFGEFLAPDAACLSPLGESLLGAGIRKELQPEFFAVTTRPPSAYSGYPFITEVGVAYGGKVLTSGLKLFRFANRIPLLYDEASDVAWKVINEEIDMRRYRIPSEAPIAVITHICSTKIPYKTVGKEYLADRPEVEYELKNATREVLRRLQHFLAHKGSMEVVKRKMNIYRKYLPLVARFATEMSGANRSPRYRRLLGEQDMDKQESIPDKQESIPDKQESTLEEETTGDARKQKTLEDFSQ